MFLHIGADILINKRKLIAVFDISTVKKNVQQHIMDASGQKYYVDVSGGRPKSCIITDDAIYLSAISSLTIKKRADDNYGRGKVGELNDTSRG